MKGKRQQTSGDLGLGADSGYLTPPQKARDRGTGKGLAHRDGGACSQASGSAWPELPAGVSGGGRVQRDPEGGGGGGGGGNRAGKARGTKSPCAPLEGLHKSDGCFVTPKKMSRADFGGGVRVMGVSPSSHEPVRIAPMVRRCSSIAARRRHDDDDGFDDHAAHSGTTLSRAAGSVECSGHGGAGTGGAAPSFSGGGGHDETGGRGGDGGAATSAAGAFFPRGGAGFVVGRSRERLSGGRLFGDGSGGAGRALEATARRADGVAAAAAAEKERDAAELVSVGYDEWKEACTGEGKIYYYNRRTRAPRWTLPPTATYVPDPNRPAGYRIFALATIAAVSSANTSNATGSTSTSTSSNAKETDGRVGVASGTIGKGSSSSPGAHSHALRESGKGGGGGGGGGAGSPPTALLLPSSSVAATPATTTMTTTGGAPSSPQSFPSGAAASSTAAAAAAVAADRDATSAARRFVVHKSGLWASPSSARPRSAAPSPSSAAAAAAVATTPPEPVAAAATAAEAATAVPTITTTGNDTDDPETSTEEPRPPVPQFGPVGATATAAAAAAIRTTTATTCCSADGFQQELSAPASADEAPPAAHKAAAAAAAATGLIGGADGVEPDSKGLIAASTVSEKGVGAVSPGQEAVPEEGAEGDAARLDASPCPAGVGPPPPRAANSAAGCETVPSLPLATTAATASADEPVTATVTATATAAATAVAAIEGDDDESETQEAVAAQAAPAMVTAVRTRAVDTDASPTTKTFSTPAGRGVVETEERAKEPSEPADTTTGGAAAVADARRGSSSGQPRPDGPADTGKQLLLLFEAGGQRDESEEAEREEVNAEGGLSPPCRLSSSPSSSSSSTTLKDFVHTVRAESGGGRREDPSPSPGFPAVVGAAAAGARDRGADGRSRSREHGTVLLGAGDRTGTYEEMAKMGMKNKEEELEDEEAVFSSGRSPRTLRRRPLGPVRRSEDLGHPLPSRTDTYQSSSAKNSEPGAGPTASRATTAAGTPATALAGLPVNHHARSRFTSRLEGRAAADAAREDGKTTVRLTRGGGGSSGGFGGVKDSGLPGSSVLRHRVRRQLFSEESEAKPLVFCPFCGEGVRCPGGLQGHLQVCYVLDRCRGGETHKQVEVAIKAVSVETQKRDTDTPAAGAVLSLDAGPLQGSTTAVQQQQQQQQQAPPTSLSQTATSSGPENLLRVWEITDVGGAATTGFESSLGDGGGAGGGVEERCEGCGRTFAPGRLQSHAKACRSVFLERRRPYDPRAMRARGTPLEFFQQPIGASTPDGDPSTSASGKKGDRAGNAPVSRRGSGAGGKKRSPVAGGGSVGQGRGGAAKKDADGNHAKLGRGGGGGLGGRTNSSGTTTTAATAAKLPVVEGSAHCPFCSGSVPRARLSAHLLRCKRLRSAQSAPKAELGASRVSGTSAADTHDNSNNDHNGGGGDNGNHATRKVRCPHCHRGFSPSVAPTHISICARVENRPKGTGTSANPSAAANAPPQKVLDADATLGVSGTRRMQQEKARVMPPFY